MSNFLIFKAAFNNSATPAIGTYTAEGAPALFNRNTSLSPGCYLYNTAQKSAVQWFVPTKETTDFEFVADILTTISSGYFTYFIIADSTGTTRLRMWSLNYFVYFENDDSTAQTGTQYIGRFRDTDIGGFNVFHQFRFRVRKLTASSSSVEIYVDGTLKLTATAGAALVTCAKIGFMGGVRDTEPLGTRTGIQNTYLYDLSDGDVVNHGVLSEAFNRFINWMKSKFALKSDIPTVNDAMLTIQQNGTTIDTFTANASSNVTANITVPTKTSDLTNDSDFVQSSDLATVATSGNYNDLSNKPTIPTVNNATLTIQKNGTNVQTFTANQSTNTTANIIVPTKTSDLTNDSRFITEDTTKIPLAGSNAISGSLIPSTDRTVNLGGPSHQWNNAYIKSLTINGVALSGTTIARTVNDSSLILRGGIDDSKSSTFVLYGKDSSDGGKIRLMPRASLQLQNMWLSPDGTWTWDGTACQITSDQRFKQQITEIDDKLLDAWEDVELSQFKYNDAVNSKGDKARLHTGYVVQQIDNACKSHNLDISAYGLYCHEEYPEETEEVEVEQEDGTKTKERKVIREASEHYSLRYTEALIVECKYLRRCIERLTARIEELEKEREVSK